MVLIPKSREAAVQLVYASSGDDFTPAQKIAFRSLYRLNDSRNISDLIAAGEISLVSYEEITSFIQRLKTRKINTRTDLDHVSSVLRGITDQSQKAQIREILPGICKTEFFLKTLLRALDDEP